MNYIDLRAMLAVAGIIQRRAAALIGCDERSMRRWCAGHAPISRVTELAVRYVCRHRDEVWASVPYGRRPRA